MYRCAMLQITIAEHEVKVLEYMSAQDTIYSGICQKCTVALYFSSDKF